MPNPSSSARICGTNRVITPDCASRRDGTNASISSMKMIERSCSRAVRNNRSMFCSESPTHFDMISDGFTVKNAASISPAIARANMVFPVPGGPHNNTPPPRRIL